VNHPQVTDEQVRRAEELISWTRRERIRFLWYRLRMTMQEMNYATCVMLMPMHPGDVDSSRAGAGGTSAPGGVAVDEED
jgi:hypothetical protein